MSVCGSLRAARRATRHPVAASAKPAQRCYQGLGAERTIGSGVSILCLFSENALDHYFKILLSTGKVRGVCRDQPYLRQAGNNPIMMKLGPSNMHQIHTESCKLRQKGSAVLPLHDPCQVKSTSGMNRPSDSGPLDKAALASGSARAITTTL